MGVTARCGCSGNAREEHSFGVGSGHGPHNIVQTEKSLTSFVVVPSTNFSGVYSNMAALLYRRVGDKEAGVSGK